MYLYFPGFTNMNTSLLLEKHSHTFDERFVNFSVCVKSYSQMHIVVYSDSDLHICQPHSLDTS